MKTGQIHLLGFEPELSISCIDGKTGTEKNLNVATDKLSQRTENTKAPENKPHLYRRILFLDFINYKERVQKNIDDSEGFKDADLIRRCI